MRRNTWDKKGLLSRPVYVERFEPDTVGTMVHSDIHVGGSAAEYLLNENDNAAEKFNAAADLTADDPIDV